jgi:hypothetical protein
MPEHLFPDDQLPRGWHRVEWVQRGFNATEHAYADNVAHLTLLESALRTSPLVIPDSVKTTSWSEQCRGIRST